MLWFRISSLVQLYFPLFLFMVMCDNEFETRIKLNHNIHASVRCKNPGKRFSSLYFSHPLDPEVYNATLSRVFRSLSVPINLLSSHSVTVYPDEFHLGLTQFVIQILQWIATFNCSWRFETDPKGGLK